MCLNSSSILRLVFGQHLGVVTSLVPRARIQFILCLVEEGPFLIMCSNFKLLLQTLASKVDSPKHGVLLA